MLRAAVLACLLCCGLAATLRGPRPRGSGRIVGGSPADISDYPWQLSLEYSGSHVCGASVISSTWAMTAAHCLYYYEATAITARAGTSTRGSGGTLHPVSTGFTHESYDNVYKDYDIALLQVSTAFTFGTNVQPVDLPPAGSDPEKGTPVVATGWGMEKHNGELSTQLQQVESFIISREVCDSVYDFWPVNERMICAGDHGIVCDGDSGGALVSGTTQLGIVSWGLVFCQVTPAVFTNVGNLRSWISENAGV
ncbi:trypsin delta-like [Schistocerca nitens]|uniref:trypsin delta-like n=1 Tax=Schistocerca nitens TaxID=7011 RepID=UPI002117EC16|nr:trypsin delta-like [Schistocerca nitens]